MNAKIRSDVISFDEFHSQHPDDTRLLPIEQGLDGSFLEALIIAVASGVVTELVKYIFEVIKKRNLTEGRITVDLEDGFKVEMPISEYKNKDHEQMMKWIASEHKKFLYFRSL